MAEKVWVVERTTWELRLMYTVDAREAVGLGDYAYAPVGGYAPPKPRSQPVATPEQRKTGTERH